MQLLFDIIQMISQIIRLQNWMIISETPCNFAEIYLKKYILYTV